MYERSVEENNFLSQVLYCSLVPIISRNLHICDTNFTTGKIPSILFSDYIKRILKYTEASNEAFILSIYYIYKLKTRVHEDFISEYSIHRIYLTSLLISIKYIDDIFNTNSFYARVGGIKTPELNKLEVEFVSRMKFDFYFEESCFYKFYDKNINPIVKNGGLLLSR